MCVSSFNKLYSVTVYRRKMVTYILILSFPFPLFDLKRMLPGQEIIIPCYTIRGGKNIKIHACPTVSIANLDKHIDNNQSVSAESQIHTCTERERGRKKNTIIELHRLIMTRKILNIHPTSLPSHFYPIFLPISLFIFHCIICHIHQFLSLSL